jgi:hypothetical protein
MKVEKDITSSENKEFWNRVDSEAKDIRRLPDWKRDRIDVRTDSSRQETQKDEKQKR